MMTSLGLAACSVHVGHMTTNTISIHHVIRAAACTCIGRLYMRSTICIRGLVKQHPYGVCNVFWNT